MSSNNDVIKVSNLWGHKESRLQVPKIESDLL